MKHFTVAATTLLLVLAPQIPTRSVFGEDPYGSGEESNIAGQPLATAPAHETWTSPLRDASYEILWLLESEDENQKPFAGPTAEALRRRGFGRLVQVGSLSSNVTIGKDSFVAGASKHGPVTVALRPLNTTKRNKLQVHIELNTRTPAPITLNTTSRVPLGRWFLLGAAPSGMDMSPSRPLGTRSVFLMRAGAGVQLLD